MKIIIQKGEKYSAKEFFNKIIDLEYIDGITLNVAKTTDNILVVFNLASSSSVLIKNIFTSSYEQMKNLEIIRLESVIRYLDQIHYPKKVLLNLIPYKPIQLTEEQNKLLMIEYENYASQLEEMLKNLNIDIYIHSASRSLLEVVRRKEIPCQYGFAIVGYDLNYIDVDYYVFTVEMLNFPLMKQQINLKKKVMIYVQNDYELSIVYDLFIENKKSSVTEELSKEIYVIGNYPELLQKMFISN